MSTKHVVAISTFVSLLTLAACNVAFGAVPDPVADPAASVSLVVDLWKGGTIPAALVVACFLALTFASRKIAWLSRGYAALVSASVLGGLAVIVEAASRGTTPTAGMIISALFAAVALALKGQPAKSEPAVPFE